MSEEQQRARLQNRVYIQAAVRPRRRFHNHPQPHTEKAAETYLPFMRRRESLAESIDSAMYIHVEAQVGRRQAESLLFPPHAHQALSHRPPRAIVYAHRLNTTSP